jgi:hypothetical protein
MSSHKVREISHYQTINTNKWKTEVNQCVISNSDPIIKGFIIGSLEKQGGEL